MLDNQGYKHTLRICINYSFSTAATFHANGRSDTQDSHDEADALPPAPANVQSRLKTYHAEITSNGITFCRLVQKLKWGHRQHEDLVRVSLRSLGGKTYYEWRCSCLLYRWSPIQCAVNTRCPGGNVTDFGRMFLTLKYTDITQNTYIRS